MEPPKTAEVTDTPNSKYWFDGDILYVISKNAPEPSAETQKMLTEAFKKKLNGKKICSIMDVTNAAPSSRERRANNTKELPNLFKAIAFISGNALGRMLAHLYLGVKPMPFPVKMFSNEEDAKKWIQQYV